MVILGIMSILISPMVLVVSKLIYNLPEVNSISEIATIFNTVGYLVVIMLLGLAVASMLSNPKRKLEKICSVILGMSMFVLALQPCDSSYITRELVGIFALSPHLSHVVHGIAGGIALITVLVWQYFGLGNKIGSVVSLMVALVTVYLFEFHNIFQAIFIGEAIVLTTFGISCLKQNKGGKKS